MVPGAAPADSSALALPAATAPSPPGPNRLALLGFAAARGERAPEGPAGCTRCPRRLRGFTPASRPSLDAASSSGRSPQRGVTATFLLQLWTHPRKTGRDSKPETNHPTVTPTATNHQPLARTSPAPPGRLTAHDSTPRQAPPISPRHVHTGPAPSGPFRGFQTRSSVAGSLRPPHP